MKNIIITYIFLFTLFGIAQENQTYQKPPKEILDLVEAPLAPSVLISDDGEYMVMLYRNYYKSIAELSETELRLAGLRINPKTNIGSRTNYYNNIKIKAPKAKTPTQINGLPENPRLANFKWSPDQTKIAVTNTTEDGVAIWVLDLEKASVSKITDSNVNANMGDVINWFKDGESLLVKMLPRDRKELINTSEAVPVGPTISSNDGKKAQNRTYQDLLKNPNDEFNFEQLALSELHRIELDGSQSLWKEKNMYTNISFSPDGAYTMVVALNRPFSYLVPYRRFPSRTNIYSKEGELVSELLEVPLIEDLPKGFMAVRMGMREVEWRNDKPSTITYVKALDGGDPENETAYRDEIFEVEAPFSTSGKSLLKLVNRYGGLEWGNDNLAVAHDYWWNTRNTRTYVFNPSNNSKEATIISERNYQDVYSDPGDFVKELNTYGQEVIALDDDQNAYLLGDGYTEDGQYPFLDKLNLKNQEKSKLYTSKLNGKKEELLDYDFEKDQLLVRVESPSEYPNYYYKSIRKRKDPVQLTSFDNPFKSIQNVSKEVITYKREDGLELTGTLYLPVGYNKDQKEKESNEDKK